MTNPIKFFSDLQEEMIIKGALKRNHWDLEKTAAELRHPTDPQPITVEELLEAMKEYEIEVPQ